MTTTTTKPPKTNAPLAVPDKPGPFKPATAASKPTSTKGNGNGKTAAPLVFDAADPLLKRVKECVAYNQERGDYWRKTEEGHFVKASERDLKRHLRRMGHDLGTPLGIEFNKFDNAICYAQEHAAVDHVFDLSGHRAGVFRTADGRRVLVPRGARLVQPVQGQFPNFERMFDELLSPAPEQLPYVLGWLKCGLEDLHGLNPAKWRHSQLLTLVGPRQCGKSFFQDLITDLFGGRVADPFDMLIGEIRFTKDAAEAAHWKMDDKPSMRNLARGMEFAANVKHHCVSSFTDVHAKGRDKVVLPTFRRLTLSTNEEGDYLTVIPPFDDSMADKLIVVRCAPATMIPDYQENRARFVRELPALAHYLLHVHRIPEELRHERTGVASYFNPAVKQIGEDFAPHVRLRELIDLVVLTNEEEPFWKGTTTQLQAELTNHAQYGAMARQILPHSSEAGRLLSVLKQEEPHRFRDTMSKGIRHWTISRP